MPDPHKILAAIRKAAGLVRSTAGRSGSVVSLDETVEDILIVGDLHGHLHNFAACLKIAALATHPNRHFVVQELVHDPRTDPDSATGDLSHRLVDVVCALICQFPNRVHYLPGNHEVSELTGRSIAKGGVPLNQLFRKGLETSYGDMSGAIRESYDDLFRSLPLAIRTSNRVFLCHTIPELRQLEDFDASIFEAEEWPAEALARGGPVYSMTWGRDSSIEAADQFAQIVDADLFICGHQPCDEGFRRANDRVVILDGTDPIGAYCLFKAKGPITIDDLLAGTKLMPMPA